MTDLHQLTAIEALEALNLGKISSLELTRACLKQIDALEPGLHTFITRTTEQALSQALAADTTRAAARQNGSPIPPLLGLPLGSQRYSGAIRRALHLRLQNPGTFRTALHRHQRAAPVGCRGGCARQDQYRRIRHGFVHRKLGLRAHLQPLGYFTRTRRVQRWQCGGSGCPHDARRHGHGYWRQRPPTGFVLRRHRHQTDLWPRLALRTWWLTARRWTRSALLAVPLRMLPCYFPSWPGTTHWMPPAWTSPSRKFV